LSRVLLEEESAALSPDGRETLTALHQSALQMARLVQDLLDLSTAAGREPQRRDIDVTTLVRDVAEDARRFERDRDVELVVQEGMRAHADAHLMRVAFGNLMSNALKFTRREPRARIEVGEAQTPRGRAFYVRDNGVGFDPAQASRLFRPFVRLDPSGEFEGTGIGLATVARVVTRHGGEAWADARPGEGATFWFTIPEARP
jgi:signal transduction histidine kinase